MKFLSVSMSIWAILSVVFAGIAISSKSPARKIDRGYSDMWYWYTSKILTFLKDLLMIAASAFSLGCAFAGLGYSGARNVEKKQLTFVLFGVNFIAMCTYASFAMRLTPSILGCGGIPIDVARYLEWFCACPVLIFMIGEITKSEKKSQSRSVMMDYFMLLLGFIASVTREPYSQIFGTLATVVFVFIVMNLHSMFQKAIDGETACTIDPVGLRAAQIATDISWCLCTLSHHFHLHFLTNKSPHHLVSSKDPFDFFCRR